MHLRNNWLAARAGIVPIAFQIVLVLVLAVGCAVHPEDPVRLNSNISPCIPDPSTPSCFYPRTEDSKEKVAKRTKLIIFSHGVFGNAFTTWGTPKSPTFWPAMIQNDRRFDDFDIYLMNYRTPYVNQAPSIHQTAGTELGKLLVREGVLNGKYEDIYFIAHSMGGLIVKSMLDRLNRGEQAEETAKLRKIKAVVFLATPAQGAETGKWASWFSLNPQLKNMFPASDNAYLQFLEDQWVQLIEDRDKAHAQGPRSFCVYEELKYNVLGFGLDYIVPRELTSSRCDGGLYGMPFDHVQISETTRRDNDPYLWVMNKIDSINHEIEVVKLARKSIKDAENLRDMDKHIEARALYENVLKTLGHVDNKSIRGDTKLGLAEEEYFLSRMDEARTALMEARCLYNAAGNRLGQADVFRQLGRLEFVTSHQDLAQTNYNNALSLYIEVENPLGQAHVFRGLGDLHGQLDHYGEAAKAYRDAQAIFRAKKDALGEARTLLGLGDLERIAGRTESAKAILEDARKLYKEKSNIVGEANALSALGDLALPAPDDLALGIGRTDDARKYYSDALELFARLPNTLGEANALLGLGDVEALNNLTRARETYEQAREKFKSVPLELGEAHVLLRLGNLDLRLNNTDQARTNFIEARVHYRAAENRRGEAMALVGLGRVESKLNVDQARMHLYRAASLFEEIGQTKNMDLVLEEIRKL